MNETNYIEDNDDHLQPVKHMVTASQMLFFGLQMFFTERRIKNTKYRSTNVLRFVKKFGISPTTACFVYEDLQKTKNDLARINDPSDKTLLFFLAAVYMLKKYPTEDDLESTLDYSPRYISRKVWEYVEKIQLLKSEVICWPDDLSKDDIFVITVDGTHIWIKEPGHPEFSQDRKAYSHKLNKAGRSYELGIALDGGLVWMNGPYPAGTSDITIFRMENGLKDRLEALGKKAIGDFGYRAEPKFVSYPNSHDSKSVKLFKARATKRHENFNGMMKEFAILSGRFRHDEEKLKLAFEASAVLCQYKLENELPLYHVLIQAVVDAGDETSEASSVDESEEEEEEEEEEDDVGEEDDDGEDDEEDDDSNN
jgi:hypothetical protein